MFPLCLIVVTVKSIKAISTNLGTVNHLAVDHILISSDGNPSDPPSSAHSYTCASTV